MIDARFFVWILATGIAAGTPLLFAAVGEIVTERAGVLNVGLEGLMLMGAIVGFMVTNIFGNKWLGILGVIVACAVLGMILSLLLVTLRTNQVATGIAFTIFCTGFANLIGKPYVGIVAPQTFESISMPWLDKVPLLQLLLEQDALVYLGILIAIAAWIFVYRTKFGLYLRATGDSPETVDTLGVNVFRVRYGATIFGCIMAGLGGAYLSLAYSPGWIEGMAAGRGWLTIALVNFALWNPIHGISGAYIFGIFYALSLRLETMGISIPSYFLRMIPYALPLVILIFIHWRNNSANSIAPKTLGTPYNREGK